MSVPPSLRPLELRLAPEYRRCAVYAASGVVVIAGTVVGLKWLDGQQDKWIATIVGSVVLGAAAGVLVVGTFRYRIRIDEHGVWRRRLVRWDLWPWEAFEQRNVRYGKLGDQLTYPDKPWYWRTISASLLGQRDRAAYETVVRRYHVPPPPPELPEVVEVKYGLRKRLELSADGVRLREYEHDDGSRVPWRDVVRAEVVRATHDRPDFVMLELHLPGQPKSVRLGHHQGQPTWKGADAEVIARYLERQLADGRFQVTAVRSPPADEAEADRRLARLAGEEQRLRTANRFIRQMLGWGGLALAVLQFEPWNRPNPWNWGRDDGVAAAVAVGTTAALLGFHGALFFGVIYFHRRDLRQHRDAVLRWRAERATSAMVT